MEPKLLQQELVALRRERKAFHAQTRLFETLIDLARSSGEKDILKKTMQKTMEVAAELTGAQNGSLFLLNREGIVTDSIITRDGISSEKRSDIIGKVLDRGLAGWVAKNLKPAMVTDALKDKRWLSLPKAPYKVRSALSLPIVKQKSLFGILTLMHPEPAHFDFESSEIMQAAVDQMALAIENAQLYIQLEESFRIQQEAIQKDLLLAKEVQKSFLPNYVPVIKGFEFGAINRPALKVGGDFYNFFRLSDDKLGIVIGDVSGKGIAAALFMARLTSDLQFYSHICQDPSELLQKINTILCERAKRGMFVTLVYILLELGKKRICFSNAGHLPLVYMDDSGVQVLGNGDAKGPPLGILPDAQFHQECFDMNEKGSVTLYTDGIIEAKDMVRDLYGMKRLLNTIENHRPASPDNLIKEVVGSVDAFSQGQGQSDDLTMVNFRAV